MTTHIDATATQAWLKIIKKDNEVALVPLPGSRTISIGRAAFMNDIALFDPRVSRLHAVIKRTRSGFILEDLGSELGTTINQEPLRRPHTLQVGDQFQIGDTSLTFILPSTTSYSYGDFDATLSLTVTHCTNPTCRQPLMPHARFCHFCGTKL